MPDPKSDHDLLLELQVQLECLRSQYDRYVYANDVFVNEVRNSRQKPIGAIVGTVAAALVALITILGVIFSPYAVQLSNLQQDIQSHFESFGHAGITTAHMALEKVMDSRDGQLFSDIDTLRKHEPTVTLLDERFDDIDRDINEMRTFYYEQLREKGKE